MGRQSAKSVPYNQPYRHAAPNVPRPAIKRFAKRIAARFQPDKIVLFGSYAGGTPHAESDVDLLVVMPTRNAVDQAVRICQEFEWPFALDLIVRTPKQLERGLADEDCDWFLREVMTKGVVLYEKTDCALAAKSRGRPRRGKAAGRGRVA